MSTKPKVFFIGAPPQILRGLDNIDFDYSGLPISETTKARIKSAKYVSVFSKDANVELAINSLDSIQKEFLDYAFERGKDFIIYSSSSTFTYKLSYVEGGWKKGKCINIIEENKIPQPVDQKALGPTLKKEIKAFVIGGSFTTSLFDNTGVTNFTSNSLSDIKNANIIVIIIATNVLKYTPAFQGHEQYIKEAEKFNIPIVFLRRDLSGKAWFKQTLKKNEAYYSNGSITNLELWLKQKQEKEQEENENAEIKRMQYASFVTEEQNRNPFLIESSTHSFQFEINPNYRKRNILLLI